MYRNKYNDYPRIYYLVIFAFLIEYGETFGYPSGVRILTDILRLMRMLYNSLKQEE